MMPSLNLCLRLYPCPGSLFVHAHAPSRDRGDLEHDHGQGAPTGRRARVRAHADELLAQNRFVFAGVCRWLESVASYVVSFLYCEEGTSRSVCLSV